MAKKYKKYTRETSGFITHPNWTFHGKYNVGYGKTGAGYNKRVRSFKTMKQAKSFLRKKGVTGGIKKTESGKIGGFTTKTARKKRIKRRSRSGLFGGLY